VEKDLEAKGIRIKKDHSGGVDHLTGMMDKVSLAEESKNPEQR
jgi:hypothetical protein